MKTYMNEGFRPTFRLTFFEKPFHVVFLFWCDDLPKWTQMDPNGRDVTFSVVNFDNM